MVRLVAQYFIFLTQKLLFSGNIEILSLPAQHYYTAKNNLSRPAGSSSSLDLIPLSGSTIKQENSNLNPFNTKYTAIKYTVKKSTQQPVLSYRPTPNHQTPRNLSRPAGSNLKLVNVQYTIYNIQTRSSINRFHADSTVKRLKIQQVNNFKFKIKKRGS